MKNDDSVPEAGAVVVPDKSHVTTRDIAAAAGVSQATVSNALNRPDLVAPATLERIEAVMRKTGFVVNSFARGLRMGRAKTLGVIVLDLSNPFWGEVTKGIEAAASEHHYSVLIGASGERREKERELLQLFEEHRVEGILVSSVDAGSEAISALVERGTKIVLLDQNGPNSTYSGVAFDHLRGAHMVATHLVEQGHRSFAFINGPHSVPWCLARSEGFIEGLTEAGLDPAAVLTELTIDTMTAQDAEPAVEQLLALSARPSAIFCVNDVVALGVLKELTNRGVHVPADLSIVGFDDSSFSSLLSPALTTVRQLPYELGKRAAEMAITADPSSLPETEMFQPELVRRDSVASLS
ncbi:LacI family transcriptional regulator [Frondihabitans sucicola]|uniref:LacI family transcriptional regulator n=1 Tax=Frondihabitans sucicola TaxID=1268041 RepID=A0ABM8GSJ0_9MICO|nr:LacI family DNA-binding transcriptional regulator [Frondihabitans sucicola]BDZ51446.1 LacI family transcriptional regulator [Frondihabitans sucicola]